MSVAYNYIEANEAAASALNGCGFKNSTHASYVLFNSLSEYRCNPACIATIFTNKVTTYCTDWQFKLHAGLVWFHIK